MALNICFTEFFLWLRCFRIKLFVVLFIIIRRKLYRYSLKYFMLRKLFGFKLLRARQIGSCNSLISRVQYWFTLFDTGFLRYISDSYQKIVCLILDTLMYFVKNSIKISLILQRSFDWTWCISIIIKGSQNIINDTKAFNIFGFHCWRC